MLILIYFIITAGNASRTPGKLGGASNGMPRTTGGGGAGGYGVRNEILLAGNHTPLLVVDSDFNYQLLYFFRNVSSFFHSI